MIYVFFIYGLAFFVLGLSLALYPKGESKFRFAGLLNYVAAFGLLHGLNEWVDMFILIHQSAEWLPVQVARTALMISSFICLLLFGVMAIVIRGFSKALFWLPPALLAAWLVVLVTSGEQRFLMADIWGRYLIGAPGIFMAFYALRLQEPELMAAGLQRHLVHLRLAATAFIFYGFLSGLIVPEAGFFPASVLNYDAIIRYTGVPVQAFRAACAVVIAYGMFRLLQVFDWESKSAIIAARDELEVRVEERTEQLMEMNRELEREMVERSSAERFIKDILETVDEAFVVIDPEYRIITANRAYAEQTKWPFDEIMGAHCYEVSHRSPVPCFDTGEDCAVKQAFETGKPYTSVHVHRDRKGGNIYVETKAYPLKDPLGKVVHVIETINDLTEKMKLEDQLRQSQKLQAIGTLSGGIAHDFNNILTTIIGYGEFLQEDIPEESRDRTYVEMIITAAKRAADLTQSLLAFSRKQVTHPKAVSVADIFRGVEGLLSRIIREDVELRIEPCPEDLFVKVDRGQMDQVLMNLTSNARDAMPEGGTITLGSDVVEIDEEFIKAHGYGSPGRYCLISVTDTGVGMDEHARAQVFEPFFTTKEVGKGTGLGLSVAYGIIRQHKGYINLYSELGRGTVMKIYLPVSGERPGGEEEAGREPVAGGSETILVAEDSESIRSLLDVVLRRAGYRTIIAEDGEEALRLFTENSADIHLLLLDVIMPKGDGKAVYDEARKLRWDIKAVFMSGYSEDIILDKGFLKEGLNFMQKPVSPRELLVKVRKALDS
jgi:PAS domain S-box-containing protein